MMKKSSFAKFNFCMKVKEIMHVVGMLSLFVINIVINTFAKMSKTRCDCVSFIARVLDSVIPIVASSEIPRLIIDPTLCRLVRSSNEKQDGKNST